MCVCVCISLCTLHDSSTVDSLVLEEGAAAAEATVCVCS